MSSVAVDVGSFTTKIGYCGDELPSARIHSTYSVNEKGDRKYGWQGLAEVGDAIAIRNPFEPQQPDGMVNDLPAYCSLINEGLTRLKLKNNSPGELIISVSPWFSSSQIQQMMDSVFEFFNESQLQKITFLRSPSACVISIGKPQGMIIEVGHSFSSVSAVFDNKTITESVVKCPYAGKHITSDFGTVMQAKGRQVSPRYQLEKYYGNMHQLVMKKLDNTPGLQGYGRFLFWKDEILREVKEALLEVPSSNADGVGKRRIYCLPDGCEVDLSGENRVIGNVFFKKFSESPDWSTHNSHDIEALREPEGLLLHRPAIPLSEMVMLSSKSIGEVSRTILLNGLLVACGGTTLATNFVPRLSADVYTTLSSIGVVIPDNSRVLIPLTDTQKLFASWKGCSLLGEYSQRATVSRSSWNDNGLFTNIDCW